MRILVAGDFVPAYRVRTQIENADYTCLKKVANIIKSADYSIVNFECPVVNRPAKKIKKTGPHLCCGINSMECISKAGFNCVTLANNHFRDYGQVGVEDTLQACINNSVDYVGGGSNLREAEEIKYIRIDDATLAIINVCENEWSIATDVSGGSAPLNPVLNFYKIKEARLNSDYVLVIVHGGIEHYSYPTQRMIDTYRFFVDSGADAVVNHHQHCYSGYEIYCEKPIFYGIGNLCFDSQYTNIAGWNHGYMVMLEFKDKMVDFETIPYVQCDQLPGVRLCDEIQYKEFQNEINYMNAVIENAHQLSKQYDFYLEKVGASLMLSLEPIFNKYFRKLQKIGIVPRFIKGKTLQYWCNRLNCESHREVFYSLMKKEIEKDRTDEK